MKRLIVLLYALFFVPVAMAVTNATEDSLKTGPDTTILHVIRDNCWLVQAGYEYRYVALDFQNMKMNLSGDLYLNSSFNDFGKRIYDWQFKPVLAQNYATAGIETKYGRFSYSKDVL